MSKGIATILVVFALSMTPIADIVTVETVVNTKSVMNTDAIAYPIPESLDQQMDLTSEITFVQELL